MDKFIERFDKNIILDRRIRQVSFLFFSLFIVRDGVVLYIYIEFRGTRNGILSKARGKSVRCLCGISKCTGVVPVNHVLINNAPCVRSSIPPALEMSYVVQFRPFYKFYQLLFPWETYAGKGRIEIFKNYSKEVEFFLNKVEKEMDFQSGVIYFTLSMYIHIVYRQI